MNKLSARSPAGRRSTALKRFPVEMNRDDKVLTVIRLILRRAQAHALSRDAIIA